MGGADLALVVACPKGRTSMGRDGLGLGGRMVGVNRAAMRDIVGTKKKDAQEGVGARK